jgi:hypothetical protein
MSYADYCQHRPEEAACARCGWSGVAGEDCDCEEMETELQIAATLREAEEPDE